MAFVFKNSPYKTAWHSLIIALVLISCVLISFQLAFQHSLSGVFDILIYIIDLFFFLDIALNFFTPYRFHGSEITDRKRIARHYLTTFFTVDICANFPFEIIFLLLPGFKIAGISSVLFFRLFRLLRIVRVFAILNEWENQGTIKPGYIRISKFLMTVMLLIHLVACAWFMIPFMEKFPPDCWVYRSGIQASPPGIQYIHSLYWAITTMTTVGYGDITPVRTFEYIFSMFVMLMGASFYAFIIGNVASLFSNIDFVKSRHRNRIEAVMQYLQYRKVPGNLSVRVRNFYDYMWERRRGIHEDTFLKELPEPLSLDIMHHLTRDFLENVPLFKQATPALRNVLLMALALRTYGPDDFIVREGQTGREIFFISQGAAEIASGNGEKRYGVLKEGDYFGHLSLILQEKRTASVKAITYCEVFVLAGNEFSRIKNEYPEFNEIFNSMASKKALKTSSLILERLVL